MCATVAWPDLGTPTLTELMARRFGGVPLYFVITTPNPGVELLADLCRRVHDIQVHDTPDPRLATLARRAREEPDSMSQGASTDLMYDLRAVMVSSVHRRGQRYVEVTHGVSSIAPLLAEAFIDARFFFLIPPVPSASEAVCSDWLVTVQAGLHMVDTYPDRVLPLLPGWSNSPESIGRIARFIDSPILQSVAGEWWRLAEARVDPLLPSFTEDFGSCCDPVAATELASAVERIRYLERTTPDFGFEA